MIFLTLIQSIQPSGSGMGFGKRVPIICLCFLVSSISAQVRMVRGNLRSASTSEPISFASISWKKGGTGRLSDSAGDFTLSSRCLQDTLIISHVGYNILFVPICAAQDTTPLKIVLTERQSDEIVVNKKYNRGLVWWKKVVQHKRVNDPHQFIDFSCNLYKKLEMDLTNITKEGFEKIKLLRPFRFLLENLDSLSETREFLPVFMMEKISKFQSRRNPFYRSEEVEATRNSGVRNEVVLHFMEGLNQGINVYENSLILFGKEFVSPFSDDAPAYYHFKAADTMYINGERFLHLYFSPKHEGENGFTGDCWIHYASWAISRINLEISSTANINYVNRLIIKQEFNRISDSVWVFSKNQFVAELAPLTKNKIAFIVRQTSFYQNVRVNSGDMFFIPVNKEDNDELLPDDSARTRSAAYWESQRPEPLSVNERKVYQMMDTLQSMPLFKKYSNTAEFILSGRKKMGKVEIGPWYKWISANQLERMRIRFDLATTEEFSKAVRMHGYIAYGTADCQFNGGLDVRYRFPGSGGYTIRGSYVHDLDNGGTRNGGVGLTMDNMFSQLIRKPGVRQKFYQVDEYYLGFAREWASHFSVNIFLNRGSYQTITPLPPQKVISANQEDILNMEAGINLRYAPGEKTVKSFRKDHRYPGNLPIAELTLARGIPGVFGSMYQYEKIFGKVSQQIRIPRWGSLDYRVYAGKIAGNALPFMLLEIHPGNDIYYYSKQSFNLMNRFEYLSDRYAGFSIEHDFEKKLINLVPFLRKINVRQFWNMKAVWGDLSPSNKALNCIEYGGYRMQSLNGKPYVEVGTGLDNIFRYFRLDLVWRLLPVRNAPGEFPGGQKPAAPFGIFGSFHIQF
jgi:hypothetical protein